MQVRAKKHLGQHFLTDPSIAERIVGSLNLPGGPLPSDRERVLLNVLEIGPGKGILTKILFADERFHTIAVDIDAQSIKYLHALFPAMAGRILLGDFLALNIKSILKGEFCLIGNFPYNISSQILFRVLDMRDVVTQVVGMFQREVAQRVCALPRTKEYGILSVLIQAFYETKYLFTVSPGSFFPPPQVKSGVLRLERKVDYTLACNERLFFGLVKTGFNQRRKTLRNALSGILNELLQTKGFPYSDRRAEELTVSDWVVLSNRFTMAGITNVPQVALKD